MANFLSLFIHNSNLLWIFKSSRLLQYFSLFQTHCCNTCSLSFSTYTFDSKDECRTTYSNWRWNTKHMKTAMRLENEDEIARGMNISLCSNKFDASLNENFLISIVDCSQAISFEMKMKSFRNFYVNQQFILQHQSLYISFIDSVIYIHCFQRRRTTSTCWCE